MFAHWEALKSGIVPGMEHIHPRYLLILLAWFSISSRCFLTMEFAYIALSVGFPIHALLVFPWPSVVSPKVFKLTRHLGCKLEKRLEPSNAVGRFESKRGQSIGGLYNPLHSQCALYSRISIGFSSNLSPAMMCGVFQVLLTWTSTRVIRDQISQRQSAM